MGKKKKAEEGLFDDLDEVNSPHYKMGCTFVVVFFSLLYLMGVMIFWMLGASSHRASRRTENLHEAKTVEEIRDELKNLFGEFSFDTSQVKESVNQKIDETKDNAAEQAQQAIKEKIDQTVEETTNSVSNSLEQSVNEELSSGQEGVKQ